ncbi:hypothetical protein [Cellulosilyticum sp. WCF-2]|uniref:hypothetical protein n=1 Tax=Cellulosilyticum sp. WCF-2 TaxID=2497860 RepID=UPI000F8C55CD|nr:hypothetical protein [Cellulosilyticum sp. WCF-2]QEH67567.1 hypothetical protein EKH84_03835 [Cellulosilyticum sp. WCF-2]
MKSIKRLKPLIKLELKPVIGVGIYLMLVNILCFMNIKQDVNELWRSYLSGGIARLYERMNRVDWLKDLFWSQVYYTIGLYLIGLIILSLISFKQDKNLETGRFLKSLPFTSGERSFVKVILGSLGYTLSFLIYVLGLSVMLSHYTGKLIEVYEVTPISQISNQLFDIPQLLVLMFIVYLLGLVFYLFCVLLQYIVSHQIGSLVIAICVIGAPFFLLRSISKFFGLGRETGLVKFGEWFFALTVGGQIPIEVRIASYEQKGGFYFYIQYMLYYQIVFYTLVSIGLVLAIRKLNKLQPLEEFDKLIPIAGFRWFFIMGVTLCGGFLVGDVYLYFIEPLLETSSIVCKWLSLVLGFAASFMIAKKIACIGLGKRKGVRV